MPPVPERPTVDDVARARAILVDELLLDFPFAEQADRAHAVAMLLLPFARDLVDGPTPCHSIESPTQGSGKSLIATVVSLPAMGRHVPALGLPSDEAECAKTLTSVLLDGPAVVLLDNITRAIESPSLARALTTTLYQQRLLGRNETVELPVRCLWLLTANNPTFGADMIRRFVRCRLNPKMDRPFLRETAGFRHPNLTLWAEQHRAELVWAALTLIRAWLAAGRPEFSGRSLGTYEHWAAVMGGILEVAGVPGFLENLTEMYEVADAEGNAWRAIIGEWLDRFGDRSDYEVSAAELLPIVQALGRLALRGDESQQKISLGKQLAAQRERVYAIPAKDESLPARQVCIVNAGTKQRAVRWKLQFLGSDGTSRASIDPETLTHPHHPHRANGEAVGVRVVRVGEGSQPAPRDDEGQDDEPI